jgi:hypothetical protein
MTFDSSLKLPEQQRRRSSVKTDLIERDGKTVSKTSTGKRKFHNKSKWGCDTCKRRRVKCDEGKPVCTKCKNMGIECTYSLVKKQSFSGSSTPPPPSGSSVDEEITAAKILQHPKVGSLLDQEVPFPTFSVKSPPIDTSMHGVSMLNPISSNSNNLSINLSTISNNPTISPQPTMSPTSAPSPLSMHQPMTSGQDYPLASSISAFTGSTSLNLVDLRLMYHYTEVVAPTITTAGISEERIWIDDIPQLAFEYPFLMHSILAFSATHLSRTEKRFEKHVTYHRGEALRLLREAVLEISGENTDALVASALILIMDSLANASLPSTSSPTSLPASAWIFHVKGAATILTAVWPLPLSSRFYKFISVDLSDLGDIMNDKNGSISDLVCFDESIADLYPVEIDSPYLITLAYLDKLNHEKYKSDFILRIFAFPALLDKTFLALLMSGDLSAMRIMRSYYSLLRGFTTEMKDKVWFLEGVSKVLPADVDDYSGGGGMHMMLDFLGGGLPSMTTTNLASGLNIDINDHFMNP